MNAETSSGSTRDPATATCDPVRVIGLPLAVAAWLQQEHAQFARAIADAQCNAVPGLDEEPTVCVDALPEATRRFLWRGIQTFSPALAELLRDPSVSEARLLFGASLHLYIADLLPVVVASAPTCSLTSPAPMTAVAAQG